MGMLATFYQCDKCQKVFKAQTPDEWTDFNTNWATAGEFDFCQDCKTDPAIVVFVRKENNRLEVDFEKFFSNFIKSEAKKYANVKR